MSNNNSNYLAHHQTPLDQSTEPTTQDDSYVFQAELFPVNSQHSLSVKRFVPNMVPTPGNVAICLSGGGSRAMCAAMGQLRALNAIQHPANNQSLLAQTRLLSTVSGGSWLGATYTYLGHSAISDDNFLNHMVVNPADLVLSSTHAQPTAAVLDYLPTGNIGHSINHDNFSPIRLALAALILHIMHDVPPHMLWQTLIGIHILKPYSLFQPTRHEASSGFFSYDQTSLQALKAQNPHLLQPSFLVTQANQHHNPRPFLVCNFALMVNDNRDLAPVQATPLFCGVMSNPPNAQDINQQLVGGGGISSLFFNSIPVATARHENTVLVKQQRHLALLDIVGTSSAFFADSISHLLNRWQHSPEQMHQDLNTHLDSVNAWLDTHYNGTTQASLASKFASLKTNLFDFFASKLAGLFDDLNNLVPTYCYWPINQKPYATELQPAMFADGGALENIGINAALSYQDIDNIIAFVNAPIPLTAVSLGILDEQNNEIPNTRILVDSQLPPLFGYQPYSTAHGYKLYADDSNPSFPDFRYNQVFPAHYFVDLLRALWNQSQQGKAACHLQNLTTIANDWFGVTGSRHIKVFWFYLTPAQRWHDQLQPEVQNLVDAIYQFPNYSTADTNLTTHQINLLAHFTSWCVYQQRDAICELFGEKK
ncbi:MAG: hypothetical protein Tsb005_19400 [Gammaproteobacteria bacterium]